MDRIDEIHKYYINEKKRILFIKKFKEILNNYDKYNEKKLKTNDLYLIENCYFNINDFDKAIEMLSEQQKNVITQLYVYKHSYEDASISLSLNESTIRTHERRGLENLFNNVMELIIARLS